jgi:plastocyanin
MRRAALLAALLMVLSTGSASALTSTVKMSNYTFTPRKQGVTLGNSVRWKNVSGKRHTATPTLNWSLGGGVTVNAGTTSAAISPTQAGTWPYFCSIHPSLMRGKIRVPMTVDQTAGTTATYFTLTLGTVPAPGVSVHEVYVRQNGGAWQLRVTTAATSTSIFFPSPGTWDARTRMRWQLGGQTSGYSPITTLQVF